MLFFQKKSGSSRFALPLAWLIVLHLIWCVVSTANSIVPLMSLKKMISEALEYYLLYYLFFKSIRSNSHHRPDFVSVLWLLSSSARCLE